MSKQLIAYVLQASGTVAGVVGGFVAHPVAGWVVAAVALTLHGVALEREAGASVPVAPASPEKRGEG